MNCEKYAQLINDLVEGELDLQTAELVNLHIFACPNCETELENLSREKEIYAPFLFEIEPPNNLSARFQAKLETVEQEKFISLSFYNRFSNFFGTQFFKPILVCAIVLFVFGFGYFGLRNLVNNSEQTKAMPSVSSENKVFEGKSSGIVPPEITKAETVLWKRMVNVSQTKPEQVDAKPKANEVLSKKPFVRKNKPQNLKNETAINLQEIQVFQIRTATQLEKVEMLFRSFRNARFIEESEEYDIAYEKQRAERLLETNIKLRQQSEIYGTILENEMLSKVEPYLLEISNLDANPTQEEVLEIKQRIKNQNLIAGLQGF
ncbi:MAG TPA: zf-HC2 domain-containing protein [Pyrinomonadaceae bacterium]|nr:zf-HC2 domain-containing protein [Pyrinomonadaceae bacterium]